MDKTVGVLGGGQLGRMLVEAANLLDIKINFLDAGLSSAKQVSNHDRHLDGSFKDAAKIKQLASTADVLTVEIEHVDTHILEEVSATVDVQPSWKTIRTIQDKYLQKEHLQSHGVATAQSVPLAQATTAELTTAAQSVGLPLMLKSRREAYDGKGNFPVKNEQDFEAALAALGGNKDLYAEKWANFKMELAVMVVKTQDQVLSYPTVETIHENSICKLVYAPARGVSRSIDRQAQALARKAVDAFWGKGVFGVEMFLLPDDTLLINEIAPRPHNSGHYTIEACPVSQYEAHLRAILDLPLLERDLRLREPAIMLNILGGDTPDSHQRFAQEALRHPSTKIHLYGKGAARKGRKMGHVTVFAPSMSEAETLIAPLIAFADNKPLSSAASAASAAAAASAPPVVAVLMGSDSDLPVLAPGLALLRALQIPHTTRITSAHRTPAWMAEYAGGAAAAGIQVLIAAAGGAAHLPGMAAAHTALPVIGIPVKPSVGDGMDSVLSILNMPRGVPVATVSVNNSVNAALLAARILGVADAETRARVEAYMRDAAAEVRGKDARLAEMGPERYLADVLGKK
nr:phosphoribosylaminoimidazole carboxylase [Quercus suber]